AISTRIVPIRDKAIFARSFKNYFFIRRRSPTFFLIADSCGFFAAMMASDRTLDRLCEPDSKRPGCINPTPRPPAPTDVGIRRRGSAAGDCRAFPLIEE